MFRSSLSMNYESVFCYFSTEIFSLSNQFVNLDLSVLILDSDLFSITCIGKYIRMKISCAHDTCNRSNRSNIFIQRDFENILCAMQ